MRNVRQEMVLPSWCDADIPAISGVIARLSELGRAVALVDALHEPVERGGNARRALWSGIGPLGDFAPAGLAGLVWGGYFKGPYERCADVASRMWRWGSHDEREL